MTSSSSSVALSVDPWELRRRFKAVCDATNNRFQNFQIRVHRSLSWLERALGSDAEQEPDGRLLFGWIAFNALYGRWDEDAGFAAKDRDSWQTFLQGVIKADGNGVIGRRLVELRQPVLDLLDNKFLDPQFWRNPSVKANRKAYFNAQSAFVEGRWLSLAIAAVDRVYTLRGQIVHGAATRGGKLNRLTLRLSCQVLEGLLGPLLEIVIDHCADDDWPPICYPPIDDGKSRPAGAALRHPR